MTPTRPQAVQAALLAARIAHTNRNAARRNYLNALAAAHHAGATYTELAATLGATRQAIRQLLITN